MIFILVFSAITLNDAFGTEVPSGKILLDQSQITLYRGNTIPFPITVELSDYKYKPSLEILYENNSVQKIQQLYSVGDVFYTTVGLNENWSSGIYTINLKYQDQILDSEQFVISRDNETKQEIIIQEEPVTVTQPRIFLDVKQVILENSSYETISITGNIHSSNIGYIVSIDILKPDDTVYTTYAFPNSEGFFGTVIIIDKYWSSGEYSVHATYIEQQTDTQIFSIQNNWEKPVFSESQLVGSFEITSDISHDYTILGISGEIDTDETEFSLFIEKEDIIIYQDAIPLTDKNFETSLVLYDYEKNSPWEYGEYQIRGMVGEQEFHSKEFILDEQTFTVPQNQNMELFMKMTGEMEKMVDRFEVEISEGKSEQVILYGTLENYFSGDSVTVHLVNPQGKDTESHLIASDNGDYYMPIIVDDTWPGGQYTAYVTYGDFIDEPSSFFVINDKIVQEEIVVEDKVVEDIPIEIKNYQVSFSDTKSSDSIHFTATTTTQSGVVPLTLSLDGEIIDELNSKPTKEGVIDHYLLLDNSWSAGNYTLSFLEDDASTPFGTFQVLGEIESSETVDSVETIKEIPLTLDQKIFKTSSRFSNTLSFSGTVDYSGKIAVLIDGDEISHVSSDNGYKGIIHLPDSLDVGYHSLSISYNDKTEHAEFLIANNDAIRLDGDVELFANDLAESGGSKTITVSGMIPNFVPSQMKPVVIHVNSQSYVVMPQMFGFYLQNIMISDLGVYDVSVNYDGSTIESYEITVKPSSPSWIKPHTEHWVTGNTSDEAYLKKAVLILDGEYVVSSRVLAPQWFYESASMWLDGTMSDDSYCDAIEFLAENNLL